MCFHLWASAELASHLIREERVKNWEPYLKREIDGLDLTEEGKVGRGLGMRSEEEELKLKGLEKMPLWGHNP